MMHYFTGKRMPHRLLLAVLLAVFLLTAAVIAGLYLGLETQHRFGQIETSWKAYTIEADRRGELLSRIRGLLGYGGIIHNFKNYVLRQDDKYLHRVRKQFADFDNIIMEYRRNNAGPREISQLDIVAGTIAEYKANLVHAIRATKEGWPRSKTDRLVKVDDRRALAALGMLDVYWRDKRREANRAIASSVAEGKRLVSTGFQFLGALAVISGVLLFLLYVMQRELRDTVGLLSNELAERKTAQHMARKFRQAVDQSPATIIITDPVGVIEYVNQKFTELSGYEPEEVLGKTPHILQSGEMPETSYLDLRRRIVLGEEWRGVFRNRKKNGGFYWVRSAILPLRNEAGDITHFIGIGEDISERQRAREQILKAQKMEAIGLLASGVAHDFNNVLTTILGNVHLALLETPEGAVVHEELEHIEIAAKRARNLVGQILSFARRKPGRPVDVSLVDVIKEVHHLVRASIPANIDLRHEISGEGLFVHADPIWLHQVLVNLCTNAAEAIGIKKGEIIMRAQRLSSDSPSPGTRIKMSVCDNGPGMDEATRARIFEPFFSTKPAGKGTGLGLPVVANLVGEMSGQLSVRSRPGKGSCFEIILPQSRQGGIEHSGKGGSLADGHRGRILLVDDEAQVVSVFERLLERFGYEVDSFVDPQKALEAFDNDPRHYDLVLTDYVMPGMKGDDLARSIRAGSPDCPIVVITGYQHELKLPKSLDPVIVLEKSTDPVTLSRLLHGLLAGRNGNET